MNIINFIKLQIMQRKLDTLNAKVRNLRILSLALLLLNLVLLAYITF